MVTAMLYPANTKVELDKKIYNVLLLTIVQFKSTGPPIENYWQLTDDKFVRN